MAFAFQDEIAGLPPITDVSPIPRVTPGMLAHAVDNTTGQSGEFMYGAGAANTVRGSLVVFNPAVPSTTLVATGVKGGQAVGVAMAAIVANNYGWYQVTGNAQIAKTAGAAISAGSSLAASATPGQVASSAGGTTAGILANAVSTMAAASGDALVQASISRPLVY